MVSIGEKLFAILPGTSRQKLATAILPVGAAGAFGAWYAAGDGAWIALFAYVCCLCAALIALHPLGSRLEQGGAGNGRGNTGERNIRDFASSPNRSEAPALSELSATHVETVDQPARRAKKTAGPSQHVLDLDGMNALRKLSLIGSDWLVDEATFFAVDTVRTSCLARLNPDESEYARIQRWFEIVLALKGADRQALPKAELRRACVAREMGVSEEQIRQIDQGRYRPLNKVLAKIDPKSL